MERPIMEMVKDLEKAAREQGWRVTRTTKGHWRFWPPDRQTPPSTFPGTPCDWRAIRNLIADLRRKGFMWPWPPTAREE